MQNKAALKKQENTRMSSSAVSEKGNGQKLNIGIMGARCNNEIRQLLVDRGANLLFDLTCTGLARDFSITEDQAPAFLCCRAAKPDSMHAHVKSSEP